MISFGHETEVLYDEQPIVAPIWPSKNMVFESMVLTSEEVGNCDMNFQVVEDDYLIYETFSRGDWHN